MDLTKLWSQFGSDLSRAVVSLLLLLLSLGLGWNFQGSTVDNAWALIAVLIALPVSLVDVVLQPRWIGKSYSSGQRLLIRLALITPLCLAVAWSILDLLINSAGFLAGPTVALAGAAVGITGAATQCDPSQARTWSIAAAATFAVAIVWIVVFLVQRLKNVVEADQLDFGTGLARPLWLFLIAAVFGLGWHAYLAVRLGRRALRMEPEAVSLGWWMAASLGLWFLCTQLFTDANNHGAANFVLGVPPAVSGLLGVGVAFLTAASLRRAVPQPPGHAWLNAASTGLFIIGTAAVVQALQLILTVSETSAKGMFVWMILLLLMGAAGAWLTRGILTRNPSAGRLPVLVFAALFTVALWLSYLIASSIAVLSFSASDAVLFVGPSAVAFCLLAPSSVRQLLGPMGIPDSLRGDAYGGPGVAPPGQ